jgi:hypothetical protein
MGYELARERAWQRRSWSFEDIGVTKLELGNEGRGGIGIERT